MPATDPLAGVLHSFGDFALYFFKPFLGMKWPVTSLSLLLADVYGGINLS